MRGVVVLLRLRQTFDGWFGHWTTADSEGCVGASTSAAVIESLRKRFPLAEVRLCSESS